MTRKLSRKMRKHLRHQRFGYNRHHRRPRSRGGGGGSNLVVVKKARHVLWHEMFGNMTADEIAYELRHVWLEDGYQVVIRRAGEQLLIIKPQ